MNTFVRRALIALACLVVLLGIVAGFGYQRFARRRDRVYAESLQPLAASTDLARGGHLVHTIAGCAKCHGEDLSGRVLGDDPAMHLVAPNLTQGRGSVVRGYGTQDWLRAIARGV